MAWNMGTEEREWQGIPAVSTCFRGLITCLVEQIIKFSFMSYSEWPVLCTSFFPELQMVSDLGLNSMNLSVAV